MNKKEFAEGIKILELTYNQRFTEGKRNLWYSQLQDLESKRYFENIKHIIKYNSFMPNIAQIRNEASRTFANYEQRDLSNIDFERLYANKQHI